MTCYFRHLSEVFNKVGITVTPENRKQLDKVIHNLMGTEYMNCPSIWREIKKRLAEDEAGFLLKLEEAWKDGDFSGKGSHS